MSTGSRRATIIVLSVLLLISVCLNLFVAGAWVATRWHSRPLAKVMLSYPPSLRQDMRERLLAEGPRLKAAIFELREARQRMFAVMRADPLDKEALERAMADVRAKTTELQAMVQAILAESLENAPASERQKIRPPGFGFLLKGF
ncbi:periplasmic heavy metal sensor [Methyloceanibacter sp.]|uniref:periplasmic heavy metal sensor n=1 Tax=Methyloceanibacter sp. TaxID=1965321 RepID=UPI002D4B8CBF|nr:periplasmic heavy metal sensor [Methyloceanibacter sp.]HZP09309.1 periplasmic heavy metal sensor [Methyloceanibacter sp.]